MRIKRSLLLFSLLTAASGVAAAQAPPAPAQTAPPAGAGNCAPMQSTPQGNIAPQGTTTGQSSEALGDKLAKSDGVLCPPAGIDPQMRAPTPDTPAIRR
jgi:hypothetical protein